MHSYDPELQLQRHILLCRMYRGPVIPDLNTTDLNTTVHRAEGLLDLWVIPGAKAKVVEVVTSGDDKLRAEERARRRHL